jgi:hypothetical protein
MNYTLSELYDMYKRANERAEHCREYRPLGTFGIAVGNDRYARNYRKWTALAQRLDIAIRERIKAVEERTERTAVNSPYNRYQGVKQTTVPCPVHFYRVSGECTCLCAVCGKPLGEREHDECIPF